MGDENVQDVIYAFGDDPWLRLESFSFVSMGLSFELLVILRDRGLLDHLVELNVSDNPADDFLFPVMVRSGLPRRLTNLTARRLTYEILSRDPDSKTDYFPHVGRLDLGETVGLTSDELFRIPKWFPGVRSCNLAHTNIGDELLTGLLHGPLWQQMVEVDLTENSFSDQGIDQLLAVDVPSNLAWIGLPRVGSERDIAIRRKFADYVTDNESSPPHK
jgi:hypothetical protein